MYEYAVVVTYDFDPDSCAYMFKTWEEAIRYMKAMWKWCCETEKQECDYFDEEGSRCDEDYGTAVIRWDDGELKHRYWEVVATAKSMTFPDRCYE